MKILKIVFLNLFLYFCLFLSITLASNIPSYTGLVTDSEGIIENREVLEEKLRALEKRTTIEIAVLTTPSFADTYIEDYAIKVFEKWGVGKKEKDNGVLIIVSKEMREARIEVGYGLEGVLTDGLTGRIQDNFMVPFFKEDSYSEGIHNGVEQIIKILDGEEIDWDTYTYNYSVFDAFFDYIAFFLFFCFILLAIPNPIVAFCMGAFIAFFIGWVITYNIFYSILFALVGGIIGVILSKVGKLIPRSKGGRTGGFRSSSGGSSGSGGGFGGGSSGGGGSSRSW